MKNKEQLELTSSGVVKNLGPILQGYYDIEAIGSYYNGHPYPFNVVIASREEDNHTTIHVEEDENEECLLEEGQLIYVDAEKNAYLATKL